MPLPACATTEPVSENDVHGMPAPCTPRCASPCAIDCCCEDVTMGVCVSRIPCSCNQAESTTAPPFGTCDFWDTVRIYGITVPTCLSLWAAEHGGMARADFYAPTHCGPELSGMSPDRSVAAPFTGGSCELPTVVLTRDDFDVGAGCNPCQEYVFSVLWVASDGATRCCEYCLELCDTPCGSSSSSSESSGSSESGSSDSSASSSSSSSSSGSDGSSSSSSASSGSSDSSSSSSSSSDGIRTYIVDTYDDDGDGTYEYETMENGHERHVITGGGWRLRYNSGSTQWRLEKDSGGSQPWLIMDTAHGNTQYPDDPSLTWSSGATTVTLQ